MITTHLFCINHIFILLYTEQAGHGCFMTSIHIIIIFLHFTFLLHYKSSPINSSGSFPGARRCPKNDFPRIALKEFTLLHSCYLVRLILTTA